MSNNQNRVLIAEDDFLVSKSITHVLKDIGYKSVGTASNGKEAVEMTRSLRPDVILMDIRMPVMDGFEATQIIQETCPTPVVILTAHLSKELVDKASDLGVSAYLVKPPDTDEIERAIKIAIARHGDMMELRKLNKELNEEIKLRKKTEKIQRSLYKISEAANSVSSLQQLYRRIHGIIGELMFAENIYIALHDHNKKEMVFPYYIEEGVKEATTRKFGKGITEYVLKTGKALLAKSADLFELQKKGELDIIGKEPFSWLGVPLKVKNKSLGVIVIQSFDKDIKFNDEDKDVLNFVSEQIATAIEHVRSDEEIKKTRDQLRGLSARLQELREEEKVKITYGIREDFGQLLSVLKMDLSWLNKKIQDENIEVKNKIKSMLDLINAMAEDVQKVSLELRPSYLDYLGVNAAIKWYCEEFHKKTKIKCEINLEPENIELSKNISVNLYRIMETVLDNVERHSKANLVQVSLKLDKEKLTMKVSDDGIGISQEKIENKNSAGLLSIKERLLSIGGEFEISGSDGKGTKVVISIPMDNVNSK